MNRLQEKTKPESTKLMCVQEPSKIEAMRQKRKAICLRVTILVMIRKVETKTDKG